MVEKKESLDFNLLPNNQAKTDPSKGRKTIRLYILTFQQINFFNINWSFVSKIDNQYC